ncbi:hypothetical protein ABW19_dt0203792 [Dactylella cylindrospora]|nr:hypothetical protein ABW19_dt0203792 [Dactylella cylindrospora]
MDTDYYEGAIDEYISEGLSREEAEILIAQELQEHLNEVAENAHQLYEEALEKRCEETGKIYDDGGRVSFEFPLELFTYNIATNKFDTELWTATLERYLLESLRGEEPEQTPPDEEQTPPNEEQIALDEGQAALDGEQASPNGEQVSPDEDTGVEVEQEIFDRLKAIDRETYDGFLSKKDYPDGVLFYKKPIKTGSLIGHGAAVSALRGAGSSRGIKMAKGAKCPRRWFTSKPRRPRPKPKTPVPKPPPVQKPTPTPQPVKPTPHPVTPAPPVTKPTPTPQPVTPTPPVTKPISTPPVTKPTTTPPATKPATTQPARPAPVQQPKLIPRPTLPLAHTSAPAPTNPPAHPTANPPETIEGQDRKKKDREKEKRRIREKEGQRRKGKDCYFGYVDDVHEIKGGYEIRIEAVSENSLSDELFVREVQKLQAVSGAPNFDLYELALIHIYVTSLPPGVQEGYWINFKLDTKKSTPASKDNPNLSTAFSNGITVLETLKPSISFSKRRVECFFTNDDGKVVQTILNTVRKDITATVLSRLKTAFGKGANRVKSHIDDYIYDLNNDSIPTISFAKTGGGTTISASKKGDKSPGGRARSSSRDGKKDRSSRSKSRRTGRQRRDNSGSRESRDRSKSQTRKKGKRKPDPIETILSKEAKYATQYHVYNVGQGHSARVFGGPSNKAMFTSDFGYGKIYGEQRLTVCFHMIFTKGKPELPILLSHWDADHYRIAKNNAARLFSGTQYDVTNRKWVAPGGDHIEGPIAQSLARSIGSNLHEWSSKSIVDFGNIEVVSCKQKHLSVPDKNNNGALALIMGSGTDLMLYPGDANFEAIPDIDSMEGRVRTVIATHHGSLVSLGTGNSRGKSIPKASPGVSNALFSYADGNSFGHDLDEAYPYYKQKGYKEASATSFLTGKIDTYIVDHIHDDNDSIATNTTSMMMALEVEPPLLVSMTKVLTEDPPLEEPPTEQLSLEEPIMEQLSTAQPLMEQTSTPGQTWSPLTVADLSNWKQIAANEPRTKTTDTSSMHFQEVLAITGLGKEDVDDLEKYAVKDDQGNIVLYDITATTVKLYNVPLNIPCKTDYPVTVQITCQDIEINISKPSSGAKDALMTFHVENGFEWVKGTQSEPGADGRPGNPGYAGGRLRLAFAGDMVINRDSKVLFDSKKGKVANDFHGFQIQYHGGGGSNGQKGGDGSKDKPSTKGGNGGDAGGPGTIFDSEVMSRDILPSQFLTIDSSQFGKCGNPGKGGAGASGPTPGAPHGQNGADGKVVDRSTAQFQKAQVKYTALQTHEEVEDALVATDWRYCYEEEPATS